MKISTRVLTSRDLRQVGTMSEAIEVVTEAFKAHSRGDARMPPKLYLDIPEHSGDFRAMPSYLRNMGVAGLKWVTSYSKNVQMPAVIGIYILSRASDGAPLALMDGTYLTNLRTGAAAGVGARTLARPDSAVAAHVGCGRQAHHAFSAVREILPIKQVRLFDSNRTRVKALADVITAAGLEAVECASAAECTKTADVITTATPSRGPVVWMTEIREGVHINAMGADAKGKQELDPAILQVARIIIDDWEQTPHSGEVNVALSQGRITKEKLLATLGEVLRGVKPGRQSPKDITVFDSTGLAIQDAAVAKYLYDRCIQRSLGTLVDLFEE